MALPHKFKIAVGGCPNNCVKPNLNDLGIIGQRLPEIDLAKCKGCKVCQVQDNCPIKVAQLVDGKIQIPVEMCIRDSHGDAGTASGSRPCIRKIYIKRNNIIVRR